MFMMGDNPILITGSAKCLYDDIKEARKSYPSAPIMAINESGIWLDENIEHWFSFHGESLLGWKAQRDARFGNKDIVLHTIKGRSSGPITAWSFSLGGSSALGAVLVALALGYSPVILCGCPLDNSGYIHGNSKLNSNFLNEVSGPEEKRWLSHIEYFNGRVKSMSGRTKEWLGSVFSR